MTNQTTQAAVPVAAKKPKELTKHGHTRVDDYFWLNQREDQEVIDYLNAENEYTKKVMAHTDAFQDNLFEEIKGRIKEVDQSVPYFNRGYYFYVRYEEGKEYPIYCRKKGSMEAEEEVMLNVNELAKGHDYYAVQGLSLSEDLDMLAFSVDTVGRRRYTIHFKKMGTGEIIKDTITNTNGSIAWAADNETLFYVTKDEQTLRDDTIWRHKLNRPQAEDVKVFVEEDETFGTHVFRTKSRKFLVITSYSTLSTEQRYLAANDPMGEFTMLQAREDKHEYSASHYNDKFYIVTNWQAKNFRLMVTPDTAPSKENWTEVIAHREDVMLEQIELFKDFLVVQERKDGLERLHVRSWDGSQEHYLDFGEFAYSAWTAYNPEFDTKVLRYGFNSLITPRSTFDYNMETKEKTLLKQQEVLGGYDPMQYTSERVHITARDGAQVPMSLVYKKGMKRDGSHPALLYGYGSYGINVTPDFSSARLSLLDRGFVYAIAHIRGSETMGRPWYEDGKLLKKMNTFTDFIDCGEYLVQQQYTAPERLFAMGGSAGGMLMGGVMNMRPDLFKGLIAAVPFVDVVTTMLDDSIPLTTGEYDEWGNPNEEEYYHYMLSYSPYDQVEAKEYPNLLVTTGFHDSQVQYWEPAKWVAKLRELKTDQNQLLFKIDMSAGHSGKTGRFQRFKELALEYAFMFDLLGIKE
ncbi:S9 family peptidase [uncultured Microscilla sp.]|uniref:S9 family peptidase n=1 Tax=uncultured Microscilla sp. TaxID=432653 RepID=UPI00260B9788|nr:S9 family peptidase [uncultured Microscilla sp.]